MKIFFSRRILRNPIFQNIGIRALSFLLALLIGGFVIFFIGGNPTAAFTALYRGSLGSLYAVSETLVKMIPLVFTALSYAYAYRAGLINIGAEGQLYIGAIMATLVGTNFPGLPLMIHLPLTITAGFFGGALWGFLVGWLKVKFGANEIITTVMLNYVAIHITSYLVTGPMVEPPGTMPQSRRILESAMLPRFLPGTRLHFGIFLALAAVYVYYVVVWRMRYGYEVRVVGQNLQASLYAGMKPEKIMYSVMFIAGGMAGLAGASEIIGVQSRLYQMFSPGYGFDGIAVSLIGNNNPVGIIMGAFLFGLLRAGGNMMQMVARVPQAIVGIVQGLVIVFLLSGHMLRLEWSKKMSLGLQKNKISEG